MDLSFHKRGFASGSAAPIDFGMLQASLRTLQDASEAALAEARTADASVALTDLLLGVHGWRDAARVLGGCFNPVQAARGGNRPSIQMTGAFTLAFQPSFNASRLGSGTDPLEPSRSDGSV